MKIGCIVTVLYFIISITLSGCASGSSDDSSTNTDTDTNTTTSVATSYSSDSSAALLVDTDGNYAKIDDESLVITTADGESAIIYFNANGLPSQIVSDDEVIVYDWDTTNNTVDIAFIDEDGIITLNRNISVDATNLAALQSLASSASFNQELLSGNQMYVYSDYVSLDNAFKLVGLVMNTAVCGTAMSATISTAGTASPLTVWAVGACTSMLYTVMESAGFVDLGAGGDFAQLALDLAECANSGAADLDSCKGAIVSTMDIINEYGDDVVDGLSSAITNATSSLEGDGGAVKVTLTWESEVDLDLHVTDPDDEELYFGNTISDSGGELDVDDRDGGSSSDPAIENIFWETAPEGEYTVEVKYYGGYSSVDYTVIVYIDDVQYGDVHTGSFTSSDVGTTETITTFSYSD